MAGGRLDGWQAALWMAGLLAGVRLIRRIYFPPPLPKLHITQCVA